MKKIESTTVKCDSDYDNDLSFIGEYTDDLDPENIVVSTGEFVKDTPEEELPEKGREFRAFKSATGRDGDKFYPKNAKADFERMQKINSGDVGFMSISAVASIATSDDGKTWLMNEISSGGLYGIEIDSDESYLQGITAEQIAELRKTLLALGFTGEELNAAEITYPKNLIFDLEPKQ
jgi:hypothetical protein